jgi:hypothetical protein
MRGRLCGSGSGWEREQFQHMPKYYHDISLEGIRKIMKLADTAVAKLVYFYNLCSFSSTTSDSY